MQLQMDDRVDSLTFKSSFWKRYLPFLVKLVITILVLYWVLTSVPIRKYQQVWVLFSFGLIISVLSLVILQVCTLAFRWYLLARSAGSGLSIRNSIFGILMSFFFSQGLPASVGSDAFRIWWHKREGLSPSLALKIIFFDRVYGLLALILLCLCSTLLLTYLLGTADKVVTLIILTMAIGFLLALLIMPWRLGLSNQLQRLSIHSLPFMAKAIQWFVAARHSLSQQKLSTSIYLLGSGVMTHLLVVGQVYIVGSALSPDNINFIICLASVPPALLVSYMPFSIAGWGVREASMVVAMGLLGIDASTAVLISLTIGMTILFISLLGGLIWMTAGFSSAYTPNV